MNHLYVDTRYSGQHGIGRYAGEVIPRLQLDWSPFEPRNSPTSVRGLVSRRHLSLEPHDVLYSPGYAVGMTRALQIPTLHDLIHIESDRHGRGLHSLYYERVVKPAIQRAGHVFTVSRTSSDAIRAWVGDSVVIHNTENGCSDAFRPDGAVRRTDAPYLLYVGNFKAHKNPALAFAAAALLPDFHLIVVSSDRLSAERLADEHGIGHRTEVLESISDGELADVYRGAAALLFPSIIEGFGLPVLEALRCNTPVVYLEGCASVHDICSGTQHPVGDSADAEAFAAACTTAAEGVFTSPDLSRFNWDTVASCVDQTLANIRDGA